MSYRKTIKTPAEEKQISEITSRRMNYLIAAVNENDPPESIDPPLNEGEAKLYEDMQNELAEERKRRPQAAFWPVEYNTEEIDTSCYGDDFLDSV